MKKNLRVLFIEDSEDDFVLFVSAIEKGGYKIHSQRINSAEELDIALENNGWDLIFVDYLLPDIDGLSTVKTIKEKAPNISVIMVSGIVGEEKAVEAMHAGASDYIVQGNISRLVPAINRVLRDAEIRQEKDGAETALFNSEARYRNLLESILNELPVGVLLFDDENRLQTTNSLGQEYLACLSPTNKGESISDLGPFSLAEIFEQQDSVLPVEITMPDPPKRRFELQARSTIGDDIDEWLLTIRDVTKEREIQERIHMQDRLATVGQLAAGIAHDFNNILAAIVIYVDLLKTEKALSPISQDRLTVIQKQVRRAASLIRQILDFSRRSVMEQVELDLLPFIREVEKLLQRMLPETIQIKVDYEVGNYLVFGDPARLQQVIMNLAVNARDAMPDGGLLQFNLEFLHLDEDDMMPSSYLSPGDWVYLSIADTGVGITSENLTHVFEPFFSTKLIGKGTGLGLAQVYGIVKQHGGVIEAESHIGEGTTFHLYLPQLSDAIDAEMLSEDQASFDGAGRLVVLAEDDDDTRSAVQAMLEAYQFKVLPAKNGIEALNYLETELANIELVVSDVVMPLMGGVDLYKAIQTQWPEIKVLLITGHPLDDNSRGVLMGGNIAWLQKPFSTLEIQKEIKGLFCEEL